MANRAYLDAYRVLNKVLSEGAYVGLALNTIEESSRKSAAPIVYGVLENYYKLDYTVSSLATSKPPKGGLKVLLMQGVFALWESTMPAYAVLNESVDIAKNSIGESEAKFVNAVLNRVAKKDYEVKATAEQELEMQYNLPIWIINKLKKQYPKAWKKLLSTESALHIRLKTGTSPSVLKDEKILKETKTGYFVLPSENIKSLFDKGVLTYQGLYSTYAVLALGDLYKKKVLDLCAAPGGKSVYIAERGGDVTAAEIYPHRAKLIEKYAERMGVELTTEVRDGTIPEEGYVEQFDCVLVDAPCSGLGVLSHKQDMVLRKDNGDIKALSRLQNTLLDNAARYVKKGGVLVYSTCTVLKEENADVVAGFLGRHKEFCRSPIVAMDFVNNGEIQFLKTDKYSDGFFVARMVKR